VRVLTPCERRGRRRASWDLVTADVHPMPDASPPTDVQTEARTIDANEASVDSSDASPPDASDGSMSPLALCEALCPDSGSCDDAGLCSINCDLINPCPSARCPAGIPCYVACTGADACAGGVDCVGSTNCEVICGGSSRCGNIQCGGSTCTVLCSSGGTCVGSIDCQAADACTISCTAEGSCLGTITSTAATTTVHCSQPDTCDQMITCSGDKCQVYCADGGCGGGECCDASSCAPVAPLGCQ
jgi:hypothetical protein